MHQHRYRLALSVRDPIFRFQLSSQAQSAWLVLSPLSPLYFCTFCTFFAHFAYLCTFLHTFAHFAKLCTFCPILSHLAQFYIFCHVWHSVAHFAQFALFCTLRTCFHILISQHILAQLPELCTFCTMLYILRTFAQLANLCTFVTTLHMFTCNHLFNQRILQLLELVHYIIFSSSNTMSTLFLEERYKILTVQRRRIPFEFDFWDFQPLTGRSIHQMQLMTGILLGFKNGHRHSYQN